MAPTLYRGTRPGAQARARDWAEIQERMLVPLYESVYDRLEVGDGTRLLGLELRHRARAAAGGRQGRRGDRLRPGPRPAGAGPRTAGGTARARLRQHPAGGRRPAGGRGPDGGYDVVTAFDPVAPAAGLRPALARVAAAVPPGGAVVLVGWGPPERCSAARVLRVATRLAEPRGAAAPRLRLSGRDDLEDVALAAGLAPDGSGRVSCPFGYPDLPSAVRGLLSTGLFDAAVAATEPRQVDKEIAEALHPYRRPDGSVRMENVFRYVIARA